MYQFPRSSAYGIARNPSNSAIRATPSSLVVYVITAKAAEGSRVSTRVMLKSRDRIFFMGALTFS